MSSITRKRFLEQLGMTGAGAIMAGTGLLPSFYSDIISKAETINAIGLQLYSIIPLLQADFEGTLQTLSDVGYKEVEFAGPYYFTPGSEGNDAGFYGNSAQEVRELLDKYNLRGPSAHIRLGALQENFPAVVKAAQAIGIQYIVFPFLDADLRKSLDDYKRLADQFNTFGKECKNAGLQFAYHNHCFEFGEMDGEVPYNVLLENTDPDLVAMELDLFWISIAGADPVHYFQEYPGRFLAVHIKDMKENMVLEDPKTTFETPASLAKAIGNLADVGEGVLDFERILSYHKQAGIKKYFIERDKAPHPLQTIKTSYANLSKIDIG